MRSHALHIVADALGVDPDLVGCDCSVCGQSPYPSAGSTRKAMGPNFAQWSELADPAAPAVCAGCARIMAGRPGDDPPPIRMLSLLVSGDRVEQYRSSRDLWPILEHPPEGRFVVSWSASMIRGGHHILSAGISHSGRMLIGSDAGTIEYIQDRDRPLLDAVLSLVSAPPEEKPRFRRQDILDGSYSAPAIERFGAHRWAACEEVVSPYRGSALLDLVVAAAPTTDRPITTEDEMVDTIDDAAAKLLGTIARGSSIRQTDGLMFWTGFFRHRVSRFSRLPLADFVSRMIDECRVDASGPAVRDLTEMLRGLTPETTRGIEEALRKRAGLITVLAYDHRKKEP